MIDDITEKLNELLNGSIPSQLETNDIKNESELNLTITTNKLIKFMEEIHEFITPLSQGRLSENKISSDNYLSSPFKELRSRLIHLTWQANQVASGDYSQRVDFMGTFSEAFNNMVTSLDNNQKALKKKISELEKALSRIDALEDILPICSHCKKIRIEGATSENPKNWVPIENYITNKTDSQFSHSICPTCLKKYYSDDI